MRYACTSGKGGKRESDRESERAREREREKQLLMDVGDAKQENGTSHDK